jgi:HEAT repeat protein
MRSHIVFPVVVLVSALTAICSASDLDGAFASLSGSDAMAREAAIRQLIPVSRQAAARVVQTYQSGPLSTRLACFELLEAWGAPISGLDPWRGETLDPQRLEQLKKWAEELAKAGARTGPSTAPSLDPMTARRELALLLDAADEKEARIIRERLARWHETLLPLVREQIRSAATDLARQRLTALRYRLVASDALAANWIEGIERLAAVDPAVRHAALDELGQRPERKVDLLLELFSDPDPMMREGSLRLLHASGGADSAAALVRLLNDPEANVRAAVLKQLSEKPRPEVVEPIALYVSTEKDADLIAHAVRVLRSIKNQQALNCLKTLLFHESWQVRAEVVEAIGEFTTSNSNPVDMAPIYAAMIKLLDDPDGFVVSRAIVVLSKARLATTIEPLMKAAEKHPELAPEIIRTVTSDEGLGRTAVGQLTKMTSHENAKIRAAAVTALASLSPQTSSPQVVAALSDTDSSVRIAAAWACLAAIQSLKPQDGYVTRRSGFLGLSSAQEKVDMSKWFQDFRAGTNRPAWTATLAPALEKMIAAESAEERVAAATALVPLGLEQRSLPVLLASVEKSPALAPQASAALPWLASQQRIELYETLIKLADSDRARSLVMQQLIAVPDAAVADSLWKSITTETTPEQAEVIETNLARLYFGEQYYNAQHLPEPQRRPAIDAAKKHLEGVELARTAAMALLVRVSPADASEAADKFLDDPSTSEWLRMDSLQVRLISKPEKESEPLAVKYATDPVLRKVAVPYLAGGPSAMRTLRGSIDLSYVSMSEHISENQPVVIKPPTGLAIEAVREVMASGDDRTKAYAGYLLVLLGDRSGMDPLLSFYRAQPKRSYDDEWAKLVYRAVTFTNDPSLVPVLDEIYGVFNKSDTYRIRTFYWTIRSMTGDEILALRKRIRDEVGMERLR